MKNKVLVLGITGLIGSNLFRCLKLINEIDIYGTYRSHRKIFLDDSYLINNKLFKCDVSCYQDLLKIIQKIKPNFVINCIGVTKHQKLSLIHISEPTRLRRIGDSRVGVVKK